MILTHETKVGLLKIEVFHSITDQITQVEILFTSSETGLEYSENYNREDIARWSPLFQGTPELALEFISEEPQKIDVGNTTATISYIAKPKGTEYPFGLVLFMRPYSSTEKELVMMKHAQTALIKRFDDLEMEHRAMKANLSMLIKAQLEGISFEPAERVLAWGGLVKENHMDLEKIEAYGLTSNQTFQPVLDELLRLGYANALMGTTDHILFSMMTEEVTNDRTSIACKIIGHMKNVDVKNAKGETLSLVLTAEKNKNAKWAGYYERVLLCIAIRRAELLVQA